MVVYTQIQNWLNLQMVQVKRGSSDNPWPWGLLRGELPQMELFMLDYSELDPANAYDFTRGDIPQTSQGYFTTVADVTAFVENHPNTTIPTNHRQ